MLQGFGKRKAARRSVRPLISSRKLGRGSSMDWLKIVSDHGEFAKDLAREVALFVASTAATKDDIRGLWNLVDRECAMMEDIVEKLKTGDADEHLINAAGALENIFLDLHVTLEERLVELERPGRAARRVGD